MLKVKMELKGALVVSEESSYNEFDAHELAEAYLIVGGKRMACQGYYDYFGEYDCGYNTGILS